MNAAEVTLDLVQLLLAFFLALGISLYAAPVAIKAGQGLGLTARADGRLRFQPAPVPYLGGLGIYAAFLLAYSLVFRFDERILALLLGASVIAVLGLVDDFGELTPRAKLFGQAAAAFVIIKGGIHLEWAALPLWANLVLTFFWVVGVMNAMNFLDVMDGLAAGVAFVASSWLLVVALLNGDPFIATFTTVLLGSLLGFLRFNFPPARLYMGDTGSLFLGLLLAALAITPSYSAENPLAVLNPLLILYLPCFEMTFTTGVRLLKGMHPFEGSPDHPCIRLKKAGWPVPRILLSIYVLELVTGALALWNMSLSVPVSIALFAVIATGSLALAAWLWTLDPAGRKGAEEGA